MWNVDVLHQNIIFGELCCTTYSSGWIYMRKCGLCFYPVPFIFIFSWKWSKIALYVYVIYPGINLISKYGSRGRRNKEREKEGKTETCWKAFLLLTMLWLCFQYEVIKLWLILSLYSLQKQIHEWNFTASSIRGIRLVCQ